MNKGSFKKEKGRMGEIKQTNFRIDEESANRFRALCEEMGLNQAQGFDHVMQVVELNRAKSSVEGRLTEITTFEEYVKKIMEAYILSLEIANNTEERVREDYKTDIFLRDRALAESERKILEKNEKITSLEEALQEARKNEKEAVKTAENALKQSESATQIAEEKGKVNNMLSGKLAEAEEKLDGYDELKNSKEILQKRVDEMQHGKEILQEKINYLSEEKENIKEKLGIVEEELKQSKEMVYEMKSKISFLQRDVEEQKRITEQRLIEQMKEQEQAQIIAVERAVAKKEKELQDQIWELREERTRLQVKVELLEKEKKETVKE